MKKNIILISFTLIILIVLLILITYGSYKKELLNVKLYSLDTEVQEAFKSYEIINCKFSLLKPQKAFVSHQIYVDENNIPDLEFLRIDYYTLERTYPFSIKWNVKRVGGTTITNTTFPELVEMVKEDCSQFQKSKGNHTDETINWSYSPYTPEPELAPETPAEKEKRDLVEDLKTELLWMSEEELKYVRENYGITKYSTDEDFIEWYEKALEDGYFIHKDYE